MARTSKRPAAKSKPKSTKLAPKVIQKRTDKRGTPKGKGTVKANRGKIGNPPFVATDEQRIEVCAMVAAGADQDVIADLMGFSVDTLTRHFKPELDRGAGRMLGKIGGSMVRDALDEKKPNYHDARKYVLARRGGWKTTTTVEASGPNGGPIEYRNLSDEELDERIGKLTGIATPDAGD